MCDFAYPGDIRYFQHGVGRCFNNQQPRVFPDGIFNCCSIRHIHFRIGDVPFGQHFLNQVGNPVVTIIRDYNMCTGLQHRLCQGHGSRHPGGEGKSFFSAFQQGEFDFQSTPVGIIPTGIDIPFASDITRFIPFKSGGDVNRAHDGADGVLHMTGMNGQGIKMHSIFFAKIIIQGLNF